MTKRANPFSDDFIPQSKVHVGLKQFNNNEDRLQKVYDKTLQLLFKGVKNMSHQEIIKNPSAPISERKDKMKQLFIAKDGTLLQSGTIVQQLTSHLAHCECRANNLESQCGYCEIKLCTSCQRCCSRCDQPYCSQCSLMGPEGSEICVSCYG